MRPVALVLAALAAPAQDAPVDVEVRASAETVEVGEPLELGLDVAHPSERYPELLDEGPPLDDGWVLLDARDPRTDGVPESPERAVTRFAWSVVALEPGSKLLVPPGIRVGDELLAPPAVPVEVLGVLAEDEDAPRPARGFRPAPPEPEVDDALSPWAVAGIAGGALLLLGLGGWLATRRRGPEPGAPVATPDERLQELRARPRGEQPEIQRTAFELVHLVRTTVDARAGVERDGLTDAEWLASHDTAGWSAEQRACAAGLFERTARTRWAGETPTPWALDECFDLARPLLRAATPEGAPAEEVPA